MTAVPATTPLRRGALALPLLAAVLAGCQGERPELAEEEATTTTEESTSTTVPEPGVRVAQAKDASIEVFRTEDATSPARQLSAGVDTSDEPIPVVFLVKSLEPDAERVEVYLPIAPGGSVGWVDAADVAVTEVPYRIEVDLSDHRLRVLEGDEVVLQEPVGVGAAARPEPGGVYFLKELLQPPEADGPYGAYAYGLAGFPSLLPRIESGEPVVAIHGTDDPDAVGGDLDEGSIVLANEVITRLVEDIGLPLGTPVEVEE